MKDAVKRVGWAEHYGIALVINHCENVKHFISGTLPHVIRYVVHYGWSAAVLSKTASRMLPHVSNIPSLKTYV